MEAAMWAYESVFYQIYPLGFSGAPFENDGVLNHRILKVNDWIPEPVIIIRITIKIYSCKPVDIRGTFPVL